MKEQDLFKWLDEIELNHHPFVVDPKLDDKTLMRLKEKTFSKLDLEVPTKKKDRLIVVNHFFKVTPVLKIATIMIVLALCLPTSRNAINAFIKQYIFVPGYGEAFNVDLADKTDQALNAYKMANEQQIPTTLGLATVKDFQYLDQQTSSVVISIPYKEEVIGKINEFPVVFEGELKINDLVITSPSLSGNAQDDSVIFRHTFNDVPVLKAGDVVVYQFKLEDGTRYEIALDYEMQSTMNGQSYEELGGADVKQEIPITMIANETDTQLDISFITPEIANMQIFEYGKKETEGNSSTVTGVTLTDSEGNIRQGERVESFLLAKSSHNGTNTYSFMTQNLVKPFTIKLETITVDYYDEANSFIKQTLNLPEINKSDNEPTYLQVGEFEALIREINVSTPIEKSKDQQVDLRLYLNLNENFIEGKRLLDFSFNHCDLRNVFSRLTNISTSSTRLSNTKTGAAEEIFIPLKRQTKSIDFYISRYTVEIQGNWEFTID